MAKKVSESSFKTRLLWLAVIVKLLTFYFVYFSWRTGSFSQEEFLEVLAFLMPIFAILSLYVRDVTANRYGGGEDKKVTRQFTNITYFLVVIYCVVLGFIIRLKGLGDITAHSMKLMLGATETGIGSLITFVMSKVFKSED